MAGSACKRNVPENGWGSKQLWAAIRIQTKTKLWATPQGRLLALAHKKPGPGTSILALTLTRFWLYWFHVYVINGGVHLRTLGGDTRLGPVVPESQHLQPTPSRCVFSSARAGSMVVSGTCGTDSGNVSED